MKFLPVSAEHVEAQEKLPFDLFDANGRLLLPANEPLLDRSLRARLRVCGAVFAEARSVQAWRRQVMQAADELVRRNAPLTRIAKAAPNRPAMTTGGAQAVAQWDGLVQLLDAALAQPQPDSPWLERVLDVHSRLRSLAVQRLDEALFHFIYQGARHAHDYSSHQALRCMLIAGAVARTLGWDAELVGAVEKAALTMKVAMRGLQDRLALQPAAGIGEDVREQIKRHPLDSAKLLAQAGVRDPLWLQAVRLHHDISLEGQPLEQLTPGQRLALLLCRVDIYAAVLSRRVARSSLTPMEAARKVCLGADGRPDVIGAALLKTMGLYPPGTFVHLDSQEKGVVLTRGTRVEQPLVAVLVNARGEQLLEPRLRDTSAPGSAVRAALLPQQVPVEPPPGHWAALHKLGRS